MVRNRQRVARRRRQRQGSHIARCQRCRFAGSDGGTVTQGVSLRAQIDSLRHFALHAKRCSRKPCYFFGGQFMLHQIPEAKSVRRFPLLLLAILVLASLSFKFFQEVHAQVGGTRLLRNPTVSATQIAFAYAQNIWTVPREGGMARRITSFQGQTSNPHFSPDGKWMAFSGEYAGNLDVYVVPAEGGEPKRLTWHPGADSVQGWMPAGRPNMFSSTRATWSPSGAPRFWTVT